MKKTLFIAITCLSSFCVFARAEQVSTGTTIPYEGRHIDIIFKNHQSRWIILLTRDIHYIISENEMRAETFSKQKENDEWKKTKESFWKKM